MRLVLVMTALLAAGCELPSTEKAGTTTTAQNDSTTPATVPDTTPPPAAASDQAEWDAISWHTGSGPACPGAVQVMTLSAEIIMDGERVSFDYAAYPWPTDGLVHFFVWNGSTWEGGKFDHIANGGQRIKLTENIRDGYNGLSIPPSGTPVAFAWTDNDGRERSNLSKTTWP